MENNGNEFNENEAHQPYEHQPKKPVKKKKRRGYLKFFGFIWFMMLLGLGAFAFLMASLSNAWLGFEPLPTGVELENPNNSLASEVYSADGVLLGKFYVQDRSNVKYEELPQHLIDALVATEDSRFYRHAGIDAYGLVTAVYRTIQGSPSGASTISQQLARNLLHERSGNKIKRVLQKFKEWIIAVKLEKNYTKKEILTMYFNTVHLGYDVFGIKSSARTFFNCEPKDLKVQEAAVLVGMLKASTRYNPKLNPDLSKDRRNTVLGQMARYDYISETAKDSLEKTEIELDYYKLNHNVGLATYFREQVKKDMKTWAEEQGKGNDTKYDIFRDGLKIYTTIDSKMQQYAEEAVAEHMAQLQEKFEKHWDDENPWENGSFKDNVAKDSKFDKKFLERGMKRSERYRAMKEAGKSEKEIKKSFNEPVKMRIFSWKGDIDTTMTPMDSMIYHKRILHTGMVAMDPHSGHVKAWVGGINHRHFKVDNVMQRKQVGSTFKPFVYTLAVQNGWSPCQKLPNVPITYQRGEFGIPEAWSPRGSTSKDGQNVRLDDALAHSLNWISARLLREVGGPQGVVDLAREMNIQSFLEAVPAICLGTPDLQPYEMLEAYSTYANYGFRMEPIYITEIQDKNGHTLQKFSPESKEVLSEQTAYAMVKLMQGVTRFGTGVRLRNTYKFTGQIAGKTGTTNSNSDGWFMSVVPNLVSAVWTGGDEKAIHWRTTGLGQGANVALPVWAEFMERVYADESLGISQDDEFVRPDRMGIELDCSRYEIQNKQFEPIEPGENGIPNPNQQGVPAQERDDYEFGDEFDEGE